MVPESDFNKNEPVKIDNNQKPSKNKILVLITRITLEMMISDEELAKERIPLAARDYCAHLLVDLNRCRRRNLYLPFKCTEEKHEYEQCLYKEYTYLLKLLILLTFLFLVS